MSFRSIVRDVRDSFGSLSRRSFEVRISGLPGLSGHHRGKSLGSLSELRDRPVVVDQSRWVGLPPELLRDVMKRLEEGESNWPSRKDVVACAAVCRTWREICKDIVQSPEICGKLTFPVSLKQPGPRDGLIQCFIKRDKSKLTYYLYLCLSPAVLSENGKFLLAAKRNRRATSTEYIISVDSKNISRSSNGYVGKMRSNFLGTKFVVYDTQPPYNAGSLMSCQHGSRRISSRRVSPKLPTGSYPIAHVKYELNVLGTRGPRRMQCTMHSIPASAVDPEGVVPGQPEQLLPGPFEESFRSTNTSSRFSFMDRSLDFSSSRFSEISGSANQQGEDDIPEAKERPLVLRNKVPRWHEQLQCWCLNFRGRVTVASVKNFQLIAAASSESSQLEQQQQQQQQNHASSSSSASDHGKVILQFGKVGKDMFTMDYRYPLSAFQAFAICLTSFDTKLACE
ncbi:tubby-like F-box protein 12 [Oryza sativa Japonica Group]|uniref:Tubby-like F-box protein 12 n=1 Tax=Oryza sativa subsp. japonica TaxID=39947 RepID=TLP12_ORYSJ|nr:tubby-like F-box protein 12 [Oryza sativa Japonica Group]NP_001409302.1 tubby-like F-box protein 12 [Oryza sativa Japonica Group]NP_001409303.1 tubby-like F-box protein 12 [Oryza sativa Japonica Group]XP_015650084.1 tubby-like F-box protein 12 isoform X1 [Oryza sativa Japonica Group]Q69U54.1 RecName: Full=Tubby-like F-box protein 12; Short=OsTLP12; AltName: Full=Tubby-like F-box protein 2; Short=OsTLP2 [Oryza sativa Japonica Group]EEE67897.1 hypothetical protein OsJ_25735 [Oryza sativa Japo|eukprot:NP_001060771.1 Os08g0103300 [Oryza sativa Japonica Group]